MSTVTSLHCIWCALNLLCTLILLNMARGFYGISIRTQSFFQKSLMYAVSTLIFFSLVQTFILVIPFLIDESDDPAFQALGSQPESKTESVSKSYFEKEPFEKSIMDGTLPNPTDSKPTYISSKESDGYEANSTTASSKIRLEDLLNKTGLEEKSAQTPSENGIDEGVSSSVTKSYFEKKSFEKIIMNGTLSNPTDSKPTYISSKEIDGYVANSTTASSIIIRLEDIVNKTGVEKKSGQASTESVIDEGFSSYFDKMERTEFPSLRNSTETLISINASLEIDYVTIVEMDEDFGYNYSMDSNLTTESYITTINHTTPVDTGMEISTDRYNSSPVLINENSTRAGSFHTNMSSQVSEANADEGDDLTESSETESCVQLNSSGLKRCMSRYCRKESSRMLSKINFMTDRCQNFYDYACGNVRESQTENEHVVTVRNTIKREINKIDDSRSLLELHLKELFQSCIERANTRLELKKSAVKNLIASFGIKNLTERIIFLIQMNSFPLFDISLEIDNRDTSRLSLTLTPPAQDGIPLFDVFNEKEKRCIEESTPNKESIDQSINLNDAHTHYRNCKKNHTVYINSIQEALLELDEIEPSDLEVIIDDIEEKIVEIFESGPDFITLEEMKSSFNYKILSVENLQHLFKGLVNWEMILSTLVNASVEPDTEIHVYGLEYFEKIGGNLLREGELGKIQRFLLANFAFNIFEYFIKDKNECNKETYCLEVTSRVMPDVISNLYMRSFNSMELLNSQSEALIFIQSIRGNMIQELNNESNTILDEESRQNLIKKVDAFSVSLPEELDFGAEHLFLSSSFKSTFINISEYSYLEKAVMLVARHQLLKFSTYKMSPDSPRAIWLLFAKAFSPKSVYIYPLNKLAIPQVLIAENSQTAKLPATIHYAKLGHVISRGIVSSFDTMGCRFDSKNVYTDDDQCNVLLKSNEIFTLNLMTAMSVMGFQQTYVEDGKTYTFRPRGELSINERISDVSATFLALESLKRLNSSELSTLTWGDFSYQQVFFIAVAQTFCSKMTFHDSFPSLFEKKSLSLSYDGILPPSLRVMQMMSHTREFVNAFNCKSGSTMDATMKLDPFPFRTYFDDY